MPANTLTACPEVTPPVSPLPGETWRVSHLGADYLISSHGGVWSCRKYGGKILKFRSIHGYPKVGLAKKAFYVHRLVIEAFTGGPPFLGATVNHKDGIKTNNHYSNLEWASRKEQAVHCSALGLRNVKGSRNGRALVAEGDVLSIRAARSAGVGVELIAAEYGVSKNTIWDICAKRTWSHL